MLLPLHKQSYREFKQVLRLMDETVKQGNDGSGLKSEVTKLQQFFQTKILILNTNELPPEVEQRVQSYQVEIDKQLRLLGMDVMFLQAARQARTGEQRRKQVGDRILTLMRYCDALLEEGEGVEGWMGGSPGLPVKE
ncbi:MAG: heterocyst frequency control protein PatD [Leptolyngbyaceae cyanobacterium HOT.MB2.61]|nr:heterocyst frequency control protein PatD [Leptolyngbyaceae cyanobacterium HOT.MB2.61]